MDTAGVYETSDSAFISAIKRSVADVCDSMANIQTIVSRKQFDPNGNLVPDRTVADSYQQFVFDLNRLFRYCGEVFPDLLNKEITDWISKVEITDTPETDHIEAGIELAEKIQKQMYLLGLKNTAARIDVFDFKYYLETYSESDDETECEEYDPTEEDGIEIIGFSSKSEFSFLYGNYSNRSFYLLSEGKADEAQAFFYNILGDFAPVFDLTFLENCVAISKKILESEDLSKMDYLKMYQLHKAEFSRLMVRAKVHQQPDIHDNRFPNYTPAEKPGGL